MKKDLNRLKDIATQVRRDILRMVHGAQSGHPGGPLGCADLFTALYFSVMHHKPNPFNMDGVGEDLFFLSNGHLSAGWYSVLAHSGYFSTNELSTFRKIDSRLQGHPATEEGLPGVRIASGSLGQGLSVAIGAALSKKLNGDKHLVYCLMGDGEQQEGQIWEATMFAAGRNIDNIIGIVDYNGQQIDGAVDDVMPLGDLAQKWRAFGWKVLEMNGNIMEEVLKTLDTAKNACGQRQPVAIMMHTEMGYGVDFMMGTHEWHGKPPNDEQFERAIANFEETLGDY
ncbi:MAG: transketolase [Bacteroidia bacterium]|nr:MAG: transketolase [Bacteroidia bacterium]